MFEHYTFQGFKKFLSRFSLLGFFLGGIFGGGGSVMGGSAACLDVIGWMAALTDNRENFSLYTMETICMRI